MKTQQVHSTKRDTQYKLHRGSDMNISILLDDEIMPENNTYENQIQPTESKETENVSRHMKHSVLFKVISTILVILFGLAVYITSGLYGWVESITGKIAIGACISLLYVAVFRHTIYTR